LQVKNFWTDAWLAAQNHSSHILLDAITYVKDNYPYWDRHNGKDHFTVFSFDHGKQIVFQGRKQGLGVKDFCRINNTPSVACVLQVGAIWLPSLLHSSLVVCLPSSLLVTWPLGDLPMPSSMSHFQQPAHQL
jgi:hypothetical protein